MADSINIFALDPGTKSGVACGIVGSSGTVIERLTGAKIKSVTLEGDFVSQAREARRLFDRFYYGNDRDTFVVIEDFILREQSKDRELLDPIRVASAFLALIEGDVTLEEIHWQQPSQAMTYATNERLRHWGMWLKGSDKDLEHQRDARRHLCLRVAEMIRTSK